MPECTHIEQINQVEPSADGCEDCLKTGGSWVHLRICLHCGHVGCCDSSPNRHARKHFETADHQVVQSFQPGEEWVYCFADDVMWPSLP